MSDLLPPLVEVKITDTYHLSLALKYVGADVIVEKLEKLRDEFQKLPGLALALATAQNARAEMLAKLNGKNVVVACKHGFDGETQTLSMEQRKDGVYLTAKTEPEE